MRASSNDRVYVEWALTIENNNKNNVNRMKSIKANGKNENENHDNAEM